MSDDKMEIDNYPNYSTNNSNDNSIDDLINELSNLKLNNSLRKAKKNISKKKRKISAHTPPSLRASKEPFFKNIKGNKSLKIYNKNNFYGSKTDKEEIVNMEQQKRILNKFVSNRKTMIFMNKKNKKKNFEIYFNKIKNDRQYEINERRGLNTTTIVTTVLIGHGGDLLNDYFDDDRTLILSTTGVCGIPGVITTTMEEKYFTIWYINDFEKNIKNHIIINEFLNKTQAIIKPLYKNTIKQYLENNKGISKDIEKYIPGIKFADNNDLNCSFIVPLFNRYYTFENLKLDIRNQNIEHSEMRIIDILKHHRNKNGNITIERYVDYPKDINVLYNSLVSKSLKNKIKNNKYTSFFSNGNFKTTTLEHIVEIFKDVYGINTNLNIIDVSCRVTEDKKMGYTEGIIPNYSDTELYKQINIELEKGALLASRKLGN